MFNPTTARLPQGSTIYITGVTGYIGAWITQYALELGYNVRGALSRKQLGYRSILTPNSGQGDTPKSSSQIHLT